eukprot:6490727-Amphidinium_carterae.2
MAQASPRLVGGRRSRRRSVQTSDGRSQAGTAITNQPPTHGEDHVLWHRRTQSLNFSLLPAFEAREGAREQTLDNGYVLHPSHAKDVISGSVKGVSFQPHTACACWVTPRWPSNDPQGECASPLLELACIAAVSAPTHPASSQLGGHGFRSPQGCHARSSMSCLAHGQQLCGERPWQTAKANLRCKSWSRTLRRRHVIALGRILRKIFETKREDV